MPVTNLKPLLVAHPFFAGLRDDYLDLVAGCAKNIRFAAAEHLFREGEPADWFYLIRAGRVALAIDVPPRGQVTVETIEAGEVLGWSWLFPPYRWQFGATALEATRAVAMDGACLRGKCDDDPALGYDLMKRFAQVMMSRLHATRLQVLDVYGTGYG